MIFLELDEDQTVASSRGHFHSTWQSTCDRFLEAIPTEQLAAVRHIIESRHCGCGLRDWISAIAYRRAQLPAHIPAEVVEIYLHDPEAVPLHDCEECGLAVPIRPNRLHGMEGEPEQQYFSSCPSCGGRTGPYFFWARGSAARVTVRTVTAAPLEAAMPMTAMPMTAMPMTAMDAQPQSTTAIRRRKPR